ncbi:MAG: hypothetical protein EBZ59_00785 [Planctomycetia bacterium]|nr:hypothetical protein [Planctomycetia bacterium]
MISGVRAQRQTAHRHFVQGGKFMVRTLHRVRLGTGGMVLQAGIVAVVVAAVAALGGSATAAGPENAPTESILGPIADGNLLSEEGVVAGDADPCNPDACMEELRRCCCCPNWRHYAIFDMLFLQRNNQIGNGPLVFTDTGVPVMTRQDIYPATATGVRVFYGELCTDRLGWEVGYLGIYGMFGSATVNGNENLELPPTLGNAVSNFADADTVRATYWSSLNMAEFNIFCYDCCEECGPNWCPLTRCRRNCHCINWLAGFVWAGLDEQAGLQASCCQNPAETASYNVRSSTNYFGPQIGMRGRREWCRWAVEGWWKTAVCGTSLYAAQDPIVDSVTGNTVRDASSTQQTGMGFIGSLNGTLIYRLTEVWGLRAGYNLIWLSNAALAPNQWDFATTPGAGTAINNSGGLFLQGVNLGAEARW